MFHHPLVGGKASIVEVRSIEIGVEQCRRLEEPARANVVLLMVDKSRGGNMAAGAAEARIMRKRLGEECLAAPRGLARLHCQPPTRAEPRIGEEIDILDVDDHSIENCGGGLGSGELVDDDVVNKVAQ